MADIINDTSITPIVSGETVTAAVINRPTNELQNMMDEIQDHHNNNLVHDGDLYISGTLTISGGATYLETTIVQSEDNNIDLNKNGTNASAADGGITILGTGDVALASIKYDNSLASKFKAGASGSEKELVSVSDIQILTNKELTDPDINGGTIDNITSLTLAASADIGDYQLQAKRFISDVLTGTSPLEVASTTKVDNLNADLLDGYSPEISGGNTIALRKSDGTLQATDGIDDNDVVNKGQLDLKVSKKSSQSLSALTVTASGGENEFTEGDLISSGWPIISAIVGGDVDNDVSYQIIIQDANDYIYTLFGGSEPYPSTATAPSGTSKYVAKIKNNSNSIQDIRLNFIEMET